MPAAARAGVYARYSSENQRPESIEDQVRACRVGARQRGFVILEDHVYTDRATSGAIADRPGLIALREAAKQHAFDVVLVDDLSRLARDNVQMLLLIDDLEYDGIRVVSVADQLDASDEQALLGIQVRGVFNELLLSDLRKKTLRGQLGQKERGYFVGEATPSDRRARAARSGIARRSPDAQPRAVHGRGAQELGHVQRDAAPNGGRNSLNVRLDGPDGSSTVWFLLDPVDSQGWDGPRAAMVTRLLPHLRQFVRVRQAMAAAEGRARTLAALLDNPRIGIIQLDRRRRIVEANDRARSILRHGDGLTDRDGMLRARMPADQGPARTAAERRVAGPRLARSERVDAVAALVRAATVRGARHARKRAAGGLRGAARRGGDADRRAGASSRDCPRSWWRRRWS